VGFKKTTVLPMMSLYDPDEYWLGKRLKINKKLFAVKNILVAIQSIDISS
jgi:hypothetical protein